MVAIHYNFQSGSSSLIGEIQKPRQNYLIPTIFLICLSGTFALIVLYFYYNEELSPTHLQSTKKDHISKRLLCYYNFPSSANDLQPENIDAQLCSHIVVSFLSVNKSNELGVIQTQIDVLKKVNDLKAIRKDLKVMISVGGAGNTVGWPEMVRNHTNRRRFIRSVRIFLKDNSLDGIDLDWEYPNDLGVNDKEKIHFTQLVEEFRMHIDRSTHKFLLSVAVPSSPFRVDTSYQVEYLNQFADFVNLMTYDFHFFSNLTPFTGLNSPLVKSSLDNGIFATLNINDTIVYYQDKGMDKTKINVGLPTYGHTFTLFNQYNNGLYSPARGYGQVGSRGFASYPDICRFLKIEKVMKNFDSVTKSPYATKGLEWISFDDDKSLILKAQFVMDRDFGGVMIYSLNTDDFRGTFGKNFTLIRAVKSICH